MRPAPSPLPALAALLLLSVVVTGPAAAQAIYTERITGGDLPARVEHLWAQGTSMRATTVVGGHPIITLVNDTRYLMYDEATGFGISIPRQPSSIAADAGRSRPFANELDLVLAMGGEKIKEEKIGGRTCDLYRVTHEHGRIEVCVAQDEIQLPLVRRTYSSATGQSAETRYLEWARNVAVAANFFEPDPRVTIESIPYEDYAARTAAGEPVGPAPVLYPELLHAK